jgi:hypothetical protein
MPGGVSITTDALHLFAIILQSIDLNTKTMLIVTNTERCVRILSA